MQIYLHRGNDIDSLIKATRLNVGLEIDIRNSYGKPTLSHDRLVNDFRLKLDEFISKWSNAQIPLMMNVKDQGIFEEIRYIVGAHKDKIVFTDMFITDMLLAESYGFHTLARKSRYESTFGQFYGTYYDFLDVVGDLPISIPPHSYLVSPELHWQRKTDEERRNNQNNLLFFESKLPSPTNMLTDEFIKRANKLAFEGVVTDFPERWR